jgi:hypothetical protein
LEKKTGSSVLHWKVEYTHRNNVDVQADFSSLSQAKVQSDIPIYGKSYKQNNIFSTWISQGYTATILPFILQYCGKLYRIACTRKRYLGTTTIIAP